MSPRPLLYLFRYVFLIVPLVFIPGAAYPQQSPPSVTSVQITPQPTQSPTALPTITINWDRPLNPGEGADLRLDTGGAPIPFGLPDGSVSCTTTPLHFSPTGGTSWTQALNVCGDLFSGTYTLTATLCEATCGVSPSGTMTVQAAQYT